MSSSSRRYSGRTGLVIGGGAESGHVSFVEPDKSRCYIALGNRRARILDHLARTVDAVAAETTAAILAEVHGFRPVHDDELGRELDSLARQGIGLLVTVLRRSEPASAEELDFVRQRAARRARQLVPLSAQLHAT